MNNDHGASRCLEQAESGDVVGLEASEGNGNFQPGLDYFVRWTVK